MPQLNPSQFNLPEGMEERPSGLAVPMHAESRLLVARKKSQVGMTERMRSGIDLGTKEGMDRAVRNIVTVGKMAPPKLRQEFVPWYERVHEHVAKSLAGPSTPSGRRRSTGWTIEQGAHMISAVSPGMDWGSENIHALEAMKKLPKAGWEAIVRSASQRTEQNRLMPRTPEAKQAIADVEARHKGYGKILGSSKDQELHRAYRVMRGDPVNEVFKQESGPKTFWFAKTIHNPHLADYEFYPHGEEPPEEQKNLGQPGPDDEKLRAVLDYRATDIAHNKMAPPNWSNRPISNVPRKKTPGPTGYALHAQAYKRAAGELGLKKAHEAQALTWGVGKMIEQAGTTKAGTKRVKGAVRVGQPYFQE